LVNIVSFPLQVVRVLYGAMRVHPLGQRLVEEQLQGELRIAPAQLEVDVHGSLGVPAWVDGAEADPPWAPVV